MALAERPSGKVEGTDFSYLRYMKGLKEALGECGVFNLGSLEQTSPEFQKSLVEKAFEAAKVEYRCSESYEKLAQLGELKEALGEGKLTLTGLLKGLGFEAEQAGEGRHGGFLERIKSSLRKSIRP